MPAFLLPLALGAVSSGIGFYQRQRQQKALERELAKRPAYQPSQSVTAALGDAEAQRYATDPAVIAAQQQAQVQAATQMGAIQRNATSGAQALGAAGAVQGQYNALLPSLAGMQSQYAMQNRAALAQARQMMAGEERLVQEDQLARSQEGINLALGRQAAAGQLVSDGLGLAASAAFAAGTQGAKPTPNTQPQFRLTPPTSLAGETLPMETPGLSPSAGQLDWAPPAPTGIDLPDNNFRMTPTYGMPYKPQMRLPRSPFANQWWLGGAFGR